MGGHAVGTAGRPWQDVAEEVRGLPLSLERVGLEKAIPGRAGKICVGVRWGPGADDIRLYTVTLRELHDSHAVDVAVRAALEGAVAWAVYSATGIFTHLLPVEGPRSITAEVERHVDRMIGEARRRAAAEWIAGR